MALATQCPHCGTTFRVAHDQLKLRSGLVRCGACKEIFNGIEHLLHAAEPNAVEGPTDAGGNLIRSATPSEPEAGEATVDTATAQDAVESEAPEPAASAVIAATAEDDGWRSDAHTDETATDTAAEQAADDPLQRMTLMDFARDRQPSADDADDSAVDEADETGRAIDDLQRRPLRRSIAPAAAIVPDQPDELDEPDFMARARRQQNRGRMRRALLAGACFLLLLGALGQAAYAFRSQIAAHFPPTKPLLATACAALGCRIELPMQIDSVTIESSELQTLAPGQDTFALSVLLRNRSGTVEAWPHIELTLNDAGEQPLVRRVFLPREYLPAGRSEAQGFAAHSEQTLRIYFQLATPKAAGYRIYLFYS